AGGDEDVLLPVRDRQEAVLVELAEVAGPEPAVAGEHLPCGLLVLVVAAEDRLGSQQHLAVLRDPDVDAGKRRADRPEAEAAGWVYRRGSRAFGEGGALEGGDAERVE